MKYIIKSIFTVLIAGAILSSCTKNFEEYNTDHNRYELWQIDPSNLLEQLIFTGSWNIQQRSWRIHNDLMQYTVETGASTKFYRFIFTTSDYQAPWDYYQKWASNAKHMAQLAEKSGDNNAKAIALTLKAIYVSLLTDLYGDIPYTEAWRIEDGITQPKFDSQKDVYAAILADLDSANTLYDETKTIENINKDLLYGGDMSKWRKFTNSLHMRLLMRLSNRPEMESAAKLQTMVSNPATYPIFLSNDDNAKIQFTGSAPFVNQFADMTDASFTTASRKMGEFFMEIMRTTQDPRLSIYCKKPSAADDYFGVESGVIDADATDKAYMNVSILKTYTSPFWFMTYSEVQFILAEAAQRGMISGDAKTYYENGVTASIQQWNSEYSTDRIQIFINGPSSEVAYNGTLERIIEQKYVSLFFMGFESWCDYRRTGYPQLPIGNDCDNEKIHPARFQYPQTTISTNKSNYDEEVTKMNLAYPSVSGTTAGGDNMKTPVWWSKRAVEMEGIQ